MKLLVNIILALGILISFSQAKPKMHTINIDGVQREYRVFIPSSYVKGEALPLVLNFHGTGMKPESQEKLSKFEALGETESFLVISPMAKYPRKKDGKLTWNVDLNKQTVDDVKFILGLLIEIQEKYSVDTNRIYASGFSGGARMSSRLACDISGRIAAIAPVAGLRFPEKCNPSRSIPIITFHGKKDPINHYVHQEKSPTYWPVGVEEALRLWVDKNECFPSPKVEEVSNNIKKITYKECNDNGDIIFYSSEDAGHTWPGSRSKLFKGKLGKTDMEILATKLIWDFFKNHPLEGK